MNNVFFYFGWALVGALLSTAFYFAFLSDGPSPTKEDPRYCYHATDSLGREFDSATPIYLGDLGLYWSTEEAWGVVTDPANMRVDKDCLRIRGVDVD